MKRGLRIVLVLTLCAAARPLIADEPKLDSNAPPYRRLLKGEEARQARDLEQRMQAAEKAEDYAEAIKAAGELLELRERVQGRGHWMVTDSDGVLSRLQKIAALSNDQRAAWKAAVAGEIQTETMDAESRFSQALPLRHSYRKLCEEFLGPEHPETARSTDKLASNLANQGKAADAQPWYRKSLEIRRKVLGEKHPETAASYDSLATNLAALGKRGEAHPLYRKALEIRLEVFGEDDWNSASSYNNLASNLYGQGKAAEALPVYENALRIKRKVLGEDHPSTLATYSNMAATLHAQGRIAEAQPLLQKALEGRRKSLGEEHPMTAHCYHNLALNINAQGMTAEAQPLLLKALEIRRKALGAEHPDTATSYNDLAFNLKEQGKAVEAQALFQSALEIRRKVWGDNHPDTAESYNGLALNLDAQGKAAEAYPLYRRALEIRRKVLGESHPDTATSYNNVAMNLNSRGKSAEAVPLVLKSLEIHRRVLGDDHSETGTAYNNMAFILDAQGKAAEAMPLYRKALDIRRKALGEDHPEVANSYNNLALNLKRQGRTVEAQPLYRKALEIRRRVLGEEHPATADSFNNLATTLHAQGQIVEAQTLLQRALEIRRHIQGESHPATAQSYNNLGMSLNAQEKWAEARALLQKALEVRRKVLGEDHPDTAVSYHSVAENLGDQGKAAEALPFYQKVLEIRLRALGEMHPETAVSFNDLAFSLSANGKPTEAQTLFEKALEIHRKVSGEEHPQTAVSYFNVASHLTVIGKRAEAQPVLEQGIPAYEASRLSGAPGIDRAVLKNFSPRKLSSALAATSDPKAAWIHREMTLARGLLDQVTGQHPATTAPSEAVDQERWRNEVAEAQREILDLIVRSKRHPDEDRQLQSSLDRLRQASGRLAELAVRTSEREVASPERIQAAIPSDAALVFWNDVVDRSGRLQEHWGCIVRSTGDPWWERLPGTGPEKAWIESDTALPGKLRNALAGESSAAEIASLARALFVQRLKPFQTQLKGVTTLYVVAVDEMAGLPVELLAPEFIVSQVPSGTFLARSKLRSVPVGDRMLAVGDPVFGATEAPPANELLPPGGVLILQVLPKGSATQGRLQAGDVIVRYGDMDVSKVDELEEAISASANKTSIPVTIWREGAKETLVRAVPPGTLGAVLAKEPAREAISNRRKTDTLLLSARGGKWNELPGTRVELAQIGKLVKAEQLTLMLDSDASEQSLETLRKSGQLTNYRYLHFATHGLANRERAFNSAIILSQDKLPKGLLPPGDAPFVDGQLTAREVLDHWKLDADLVTLSACETAVGRTASGDGRLGFAQAFLTAGSRTVCLSLWKVDDTATALLMTRFYQNLLGRRPGLNKPMRKAAALHEARQWLRDLSATEALGLVASSTHGVVRTDRGKGEELRLALPVSNAEKTADVSPTPFFHPRYWSAFILIGDPD